MNGYQIPKDRPKLVLLEGSKSLIWLASSYKHSFIIV